MIQDMEPLSEEIIEDIYENYSSDKMTQVLHEFDQLYAPLKTDLPFKPPEVREQMYKLERILKDIDYDRAIGANFEDLHELVESIEWVISDIEQRAETIRKLINPLSEILYRHMPEDLY